MRVASENEIDFIRHDKCLLLLRFCNCLPFRKIMILSCYMVIVAIVSLNILMCPNESLKTAQVGTSSMALHMLLKVSMYKTK